MDYPVRQKSAHGQPKAPQFMRDCHVCHADFLALAAGKTGEAGLWDDRGGLRWYCSVECAALAGIDVTAYRQAWGRALCASIPGGLLDTLPPDAARLQETLRLLVLQQRAMAGDERARAELAALMEGRQG